MRKEVEHKGFVIAWEDPPRTSAWWELDIASNDPALMAIILQYTNSHGSYPLQHPGDLEGALTEARRTIDQWLLAHSGTK